jgi:hypothetical protein
MLSLLRNVVLASIRDTRHSPLDSSIFNRAPFTLFGGRTKMETIFGGREKLSAIIEELNQLIVAA